MQIYLTPQRREEHISINRQGNALIINGQEFDFSSLTDGATLPAEAVDSAYFAGPVERVNGELHLTLLLPHGANPSEEVAFPKPITVTENGPVELPQ